MIGKIVPIRTASDPPGYMSQSPLDLNKHGIGTGSIYAESAKFRNKEKPSASLLGRARLTPQR